MPTVAVLHHLDPPVLGHVASLRDGGAELDERNLRRGDPLPDLAAVDAVVTLGGDQSVREVARHDYLVAEAALLREAVAREVPVLAVCLGGQLLAHALGATVRRASRCNIEWRTLRPTPAGAEDPLVRALPGAAAGGAGVPALHWNEDVFDLPAGATDLLERPDEGVEAFRAGPCAWGFQFHPDVDAVLLDDWYRTYAGWLEEAGIAEAEAREADAANLERQAESSRALFRAFAELVA